jgi:hypothetical protein
MEDVGRMLIVAGVVLAALGLLLWAGPSIPFLGKLPGDLRIERDGVRIFVPITSCLVVSAVVSLALWAFGKLR